MANDTDNKDDAATTSSTEYSLDKTPAVANGTVSEQKVVATSAPVVAVKALEAEPTAAEPFTTSDFGGNSNNKKRGHKFCGNCCDVRRAVIIINIIHLCSVLFTVVVLLFALAAAEGGEEDSSSYVAEEENNNANDDDAKNDDANAKNDDAANDDANAGDDDAAAGGGGYYNYNDDDLYGEDGDEDTTTLPFAIKMRIYLFYAIIYTAVQFAVSSIGIYGAISYNPWMVGTTGIVFCIHALMALTTSNVIGFVINAIYAYPHYYLVQEINSGIMSPQTYKTHEEHSCCCV